MHRQGIQPHKHRYPFSLELSSHPGCHMTLSRIPCGFLYQLDFNPGATVWQPVLQQHKVFLPSPCRDYHLPSCLSSVQSPGSFSPYLPEQLDTGRGTVPCAQGEGVTDSSRNDLSVTWLHWLLSRAMLFTCTFIHAKFPHKHCASRKRPSIYSKSGQRHLLGGCL